MRTSTDVLVVGGGPVGLMLAGELQRRGIDHLVIDQRPQPEYYCKALGITPRTLEVWDQIGVLEDALRLGRFMAGITGAQNGQQTGVETARPCGMPFGFMTLAQYDTEQLLRRHLARHGGRVHHDATLLDFELAADRVRARVRSGGAERTIECAYLAGCDGAHSTARKQLGLDYEGDAYAMTFMLGDVRLHWDRPRQYGHRLSQIVDGQLQNMLICIPIPGDPQRYRLSMAAPPEYWEEHADLHTPPTFEQLAAAAAAMLPPGAQISDLR